jgi:hypothetical protein
MYCRLALVLLLLLLPGCTQRSCNEQEPNYTQTLTTLQAEWQNAVTRAEATPPELLTSEVTFIQDIRQRAVAVDVPECGISAHTALLGVIDTTLDLLTARQEQQPADVVEAKRMAAVQALQRLNDMMAALGVKATQTIPKALIPLQSKINDN